MYGTTRRVGAPTCEADRSVPSVLQSMPRLQVTLNAEGPTLLLYSG